MSPVATHLLINPVQAAFLLALAPLLEGVLKRLEEIIQGKYRTRSLVHLEKIKPGHVVTWLADIWMGDRL